MDGKTEAQRGQVSCLRSHSELGLVQDLSDFRFTSSMVPTQLQPFFCWLNPHNYPAK